MAEKTTSEIFSKLHRKINETANEINNNIDIVASAQYKNFSINEYTVEAPQDIPQWTTNSILTSTANWTSSKNVFNQGTPVDAWQIYLYGYGDYISSGCFFIEADTDSSWYSSTSGAILTKSPHQTLTINISRYGSVSTRITDIAGIGIEADTKQLYVEVYDLLKNKVKIHFPPNSTFETDTKSVVVKWPYGSVVVLPRHESDLTCNADGSINIKLTMKNSQLYTLLNKDISYSFYPESSGRVLIHLFLRKASFPTAPNGRIQFSAARRATLDDEQILLPNININSDWDLFSQTLYLMDAKLKIHSKDSLGKDYLLTCVQDESFFNNENPPLYIQLAGTDGQKEILAKLRIQKDNTQTVLTIELDPNFIPSSSNKYFFNNSTFFKNKVSIWLLASPEPIKDNWSGD